jgi:hypothetical protein
VTIRAVEVQAANDRQKRSVQFRGCHFFWPNLLLPNSDNGSKILTWANVCTVHAPVIAISGQLRNWHQVP